jgi:hypothetical protein
MTAIKRVAAGLLLAGACVACSGAPPLPPTVVPGTTPTAVRPPATPTTAPTRDPQAAPSFAEIKAAIGRIQQETAGQSYEAQQKAFADYTATLTGKPVHGWDGWVSSVYNDQGTSHVFVYAEDPYSTAPTPTPVVDKAGNKYTSGPTTLDLTGVPAAQTQSLHPGDHLQIEATIERIEASYEFAMVLNNASVLSLEPPVAAGPSATPQAIATPVAVPPRTPVVGPNEAPTAAEILAKFQASQGGQGMDTYLASLFGKTVTDWDGWVVSPEEVPAVESQVPGIALVLSDPYAAVTPNLTPVAPGRGPGDAAVVLTVKLQSLSADTIKQLRVGQRLRFSGKLGKIDNNYGAIELPIQQTGVTMVEDRLAGLIAPPDLANVKMGLVRDVCFGSCPAYHLTVYGNGVVVWQGDRFVAVPGMHIAVVSQDTVRRLVAAFEKADYFGMNDAYTEYMVTDAPYATTLFQQGERRKMIRHYQGDRSAPAKLDILETQIDMLIGTDQWIGRER